MFHKRGWSCRCFPSGRRLWIPALALLLIPAFDLQAQEKKEPITELLNRLSSLDATDVEGHKKVLEGLSAHGHAARHVAPAVEDLAGDWQEPAIRVAALAALGKFGAVESIFRVLREEPEGLHFEHRAYSALEEAGGFSEKYFPELFDLFRYVSDSPLLAGKIAEVGKGKALGFAIDVANMSEVRLRSARDGAILTLGFMSHSASTAEPAIRALEALTSDPDEAVRYRAAGSLSTVAEDYAKKLEEAADLDGAVAVHDRAIAAVLKVGKRASELHKVVLLMRVVELIHARAWLHLRLGRPEPVLEHVTGMMDGTSLFLRGEALRLKRAYREAIPVLTDAIENLTRLQKRQLVIDARWARAQALCAVEEYAKAVEDASAVLKYADRFFVGYRLRGHCYRRTGRMEEAYKDWDKALEIRDDDPSLLNAFAWSLATCPEEKYRDGDRAVRLALRAVKLDPSPWWRDTLAAAYAETGNFTRAIEVQRKAIEIAEAEKDTALVKELKQHLELFQNSKPVRE